MGRTDMSDMTYRPLLKKKDLSLKIFSYAICLCIVWIILDPTIEFIKFLFGGTMLIEVGPGYYQEVTAPKSDFSSWKSFVKFLGSRTFKAFINSLIVSFGTTMLCTYLSAITAYATVAYDWKLKRIFNNLIIGFMMLPGTIATIGFIQIAYKFSWNNHLSTMILGFVASPLTVFFMRMYLQATFSKEMLESARIDGAGEFRIFNQIMLPMLKPAIATQAIFIFMDSWYTQFLAQVLLTDVRKQTLQSLNMVDAANTTVYILMYAVPVIVYLIFAKNIVEGVSLGSVKA